MYLTYYIYTILKIFRTKIVHTSGICFDCLLREKSHIQKIHRIRIRYSKYQFIIQNTPTMSNHIKKISNFEKI